MKNQIKIMKEQGFSDFWIKDTLLTRKKLKEMGAKLREFNLAIYLLREYIGNRMSSC